MHRLHHSVLVFFLLMTISSATRADKVDDYIKTQMQMQHIPGLSLAVVRDGKILKAKGYGFANLELNAPATPETVYQLASNTKQFTATAIMLLVQDGKLSLDEKISKYVENTPDAWKDITVRHLLTHTSGIPDYLTDALDQHTREPGPDTTSDKIVQMVAGLPVKFAPGEKFSYSNTNYVLLGIIVHKLSGKTYDTFLAERVFQPLGMTATGLDNPGDIVPNRAAGYAWTGDKWQNSAYLNPTTWNNGDGGIRSTVLDIAKWDAALYSDQILTMSSREAMWTRVKLNGGSTPPYGFGWYVSSVNGHKCVFHSGSRPGTAVVIWRYPNDKLTVIILANLHHTNVVKMARNVAGLYVSAVAAPI